MASQDVIELGSSDDEPEPAPKRTKPKPRLNAMVHIPTNLSGLTIKKSKPNGQTPKPPQLSKSIRIGPIKAPFRPVSIPVVSTQVKPNLNPLNIIKSINNSQIQIKKVKSVHITPQAVAMKRTGNPSPKPQRVLRAPMNINSKGLTNLNQIVQTSNLLKKIYNSSNPQPQSSKSISHLPPGITVKPVKQINDTHPIPKRPIKIPPVMPPAKKKKPNPATAIGEVLTVELDDDDSSMSNNSPQWYMRPEDQKSDKTLEEKNNKEPETHNFIEITIEDSPIKPAPSKRTKEIGDEASINIDDSPIKGPEQKAQNDDMNSGSDEETAALPKKTPNSKKKLHYAKEMVNEQCREASASTEGDPSSPTTIEIEIPPLEFEVNQVSVNNEKVTELVSNDVIEILESPAKKKMKPTTVKPNKVPLTDKIIEPVIESMQSALEKTEFHPTYQTFIDLCFKLENSEDMKKIVEKKIKTYYLQVPKEYTESEEFLEMVSSKIMSMKAGPEKMYLYIKDIVDELNLQRKMAKSHADEKEKEHEKAAAEFYGEELEADTKRKRQVRKLEKTLKKLNRAIHKLEEQEVDFDDDGDSVYILTESEDEIETTSGKEKDKPERDKQVLLQRYKERLVRVHAKLCQLSNTKMPSEPRVHIEQRPGKPAGPAKRLEKWINKRVPVGTPLPFPDFHDVLRCVRDANEEDKLGWNEVDVMEEARDLFTRCGKKLQRRRQENEWRLAASRLPPEADPAEESADLKKKLEENRKVSSQREAELINKYADRQKQLQLEAVEIGDKEAEESPVESGDEVQEEERQEEEILESTEGRKERLKRLLKEKSKGATKNVQPIELDDDEDNNAIKEKTNNEERKSPENAKENDDTSDKSEDGDIKRDDVADDNAGANNAKKDSLKDSINPSGNNDDVHSLSDDSKDVGSEVDELNLLQKLHSGTDIATSTLESSDTDTPIAISDTLGSSDDVQKKGSKHSSDIVSIENSSYSESEAQEKEDRNTEEEVVVDTSEAQNEDPLKMNIDSDRDSPKKNRDSNDEYTEPLEDILLASSDEEDTIKETQSVIMTIDDDIDDSFVNLKDDSISIGDTVIEGSAEPNSGKNSGEPVQPKDNTTSQEIAKTNCDVFAEVSGPKVDKVGEESVPIGDELKESEPKGDDAVTEFSGEPNGKDFVEELDEPKSISAVEEALELEYDKGIEASEEADKLKTSEVVVESDKTKDHTMIETTSNPIGEKMLNEPESDEESKSCKVIEASGKSIDEVIEKTLEPKIDNTIEKAEVENSKNIESVSVEADNMVTDNGDVSDNYISDHVQNACADEAKIMDVDPDNCPDKNTEERKENSAGNNEAMDTTA